jgi:toxin ParE1/3/4
VTRTVQWSRAALDDLKAQVAYIARDNADAARRIADRVLTTAASLGDRLTGRPGRISGSYEKSVPRLPYILVYEVDAVPGREIVSILHLIHTSRDWPKT